METVSTTYPCLSSYASPVGTLYDVMTTNPLKINTVGDSQITTNEKGETVHIYTTTNPDTANKRLKQATGPTP